MEDKAVRMRRENHGRPGSPTRPWLMRNHQQVIAATDGAPEMDTGPSAGRLGERVLKRRALYPGQGQATGSEQIQAMSRQGSENRKEREHPARAGCPKRFEARGFTLIELLVTITVAIILIGIAVPNYRSYVMRANRSDATTALLRIAAAQEKFYIQNNTYTTDLSDAGLGVPGTNNGYYDLSVAAGANGLTAGYTATATAKAGERQADDSKCQSYTINERGVRGSSPEPPKVCWK